MNKSITSINPLMKSRKNLIKIFIFDKPFGISTNISLNSFINGGNTRIKIVNIITDMTAKTINKDINRGIFKPFWI